MGGGWTILKSERTRTHSIRKGGKEQEPRNIDVASVKCMCIELFGRILIQRRLNVTREFFSRRSISLRFMKIRKIILDRPCTAIQIKIAGPENRRKT
jgi:hypothetical protein